MSNRLLEFTNALSLSNAIEERLDSSGGEITPEIEEALDRVAAGVARSCDDTGRFIDRINHGIVFWKEQEDAARKVRKSLEEVLFLVKSKILKVLPDGGAEGATTRLSKQLNPGRLEIEQDRLHPQFILIKTVYEPDNERIKKLLLDGAIIEGAEIVKDYSLRVRKVSIKE